MIYAILYLVLCSILFTFMLNNAKACEGEVNVGSFLTAFGFSYVPLLNVFTIYIIVAETMRFDAMWDRLMQKKLF